MDNRREFKVCGACGVPSVALNEPCQNCGYHPRRVTIRLRVSATKPLEPQPPAPEMPEPNLWPFVILLGCAVVTLVTCTLFGPEEIVP